ncbi:hypothetical protein CSB69_3203 [Morganella morganii]|nr:hypothetical protein CSB69_3203 [Morganella morganii]EMP53366.1 hypothetical protein C790_01557 [Morganella morganii SC01]
MHGDNSGKANGRVSHPGQGVNPFLSYRPQGVIAIKGYKTS